MGTKYCNVTIIEFETSDGDYPIVYGKGQHKDDLVYFQLDGGFLRQPDQIREGGRIKVTEDEEVGRAIKHF